MGDPTVRFDEDALRLVRAARLAAQLDFEIEPRTRAAMSATAELMRWVSQERIGAELRRMVAADPPSTAFAILAETGLLAPVLPELAAQSGVAQDKLPGHDLWDHSLATLDAAAGIDPPNQLLRIAALLHDIGKPTMAADGHFIGHDEEGARMAEVLLTRLAFPRRDIERVSRLIGAHMFSYEPRWTAAAVRRFIKRVGPPLIDDLLNLRAADNLGSGLPANTGHLDELRRRVGDELAARPPLELRDLAVHGDDLVRELGIAPGPHRRRVARSTARLGHRRPGAQRAGRAARRRAPLHCPESGAGQMIEAMLQAERALLHGMVDQAEQIYSNAVLADPRNAIAMVGLARVALERGDDRLAYERACAALAIDPQNAAALRLEARLSEVLVTRGEQVQRPAGFEQEHETTNAQAADVPAPHRPSLLRRLMGG